MYLCKIIKITSSNRDSNNKNNNNNNNKKFKPSFPSPRIQLLCIASAILLLWLMLMETRAFKAGQTGSLMAIFNGVFRVAGVYFALTSGLFAYMVRD